MTSSLFAPDHVQQWAALRPPHISKEQKQAPPSQDEVAVLRKRKIQRNAMKKQLAKELQVSERVVEVELSRLVEQLATDNKTSVPEYLQDPHHPDNRIDHRKQGGPLLQYLWSHDEPLQGQTLYLGGEVASDGNMYCIPGHAPKVLVIDPENDTIYPVGPPLQSNGHLYKWLRGIVVGHIIYGLPCHADEILKIDTSAPGAPKITKIPIPYEDFFPNDPQEAQEQRELIWKYHGGAISPHDQCIYAIPQRALQVLKFDPKTETVSLVGPKFPGKCKWYGGIIGKQDGAIYGVPQNASGVLRIMPDAVTIHGDYGQDNHKWHGGAAAANGVIVSVPANADSVLCITPGNPPTLQEIGTADIIQSGRHRDDGKYKYLGAMSGTNGKVYIFPCASEYVLQVDAEKFLAKNVGPNLRDTGMETVYQNKWQNGLTCVQDDCVYGISLSGHTLLRIDCSKTKEDPDQDPEVTTWLIPSPRRDCRDKFEGGIITASGVMYTVPNNHKGVLRIEPANLKTTRL